MGLTPDIYSPNGPLKMPLHLMFSAIYLQPARAKHQWTVNQKSRRSHMFSFRAEASMVDGNNRLLLFVSPLPLFFCHGKIIYGWIADVFFGSRLTEWGEKKDGRNKWEAGGVMPWKHSFYHSIKIYTTTAGLQLTPSLCALDWHLFARLQIAFRVASQSVSYPLGARARGVEILQANRKSGCERSERPAAADTSRNRFSHRRAV